MTAVDFLIFYQLSLIGKRDRLALKIDDDTSGKIYTYNTKCLYVL